MGCVIYKGMEDIPQVMNSRALAIVSTPKAIMTDRKARAAGVGGEFAVRGRVIGRF